jgi:hypothetical protein
VILCHQTIRPQAHLCLHSPIVVKSRLSWEGWRGRWCGRTRGLSAFLRSTSSPGKTLAEALPLFPEFPVWRLHPIIYTSSNDDLPSSEWVSDPPDSDQGFRDIRSPKHRDSTSDFGTAIWSTQEWNLLLASGVVSDSKRPPRLMMIRAPRASIHLLVLFPPSSGAIHRWMNTSSNLTLVS